MIKVAYSGIYHHPLPQGHRFPMEKYSLLPEQLLREGTLHEANFFPPKKVNEKQILRAHTEAYLHSLLDGSISAKAMRKVGFPYSSSLVERELSICGGTVANAYQAIENGCAMNIAGGTHHAYADRGEGFCLLNDIAIAACDLLSTKTVAKIAVVDLDVHQGNGTASIFEEEPRVFTASIHGKNNYPLHKEKGDLDIPVLDQTTDDEYLAQVKFLLEILEKKVKPEFIFFQAGVDVLATDKLGRMALTIEGCKQRDEMVLDFCKTNNIPVAVNMGGGYSPEIKYILEAHANTYRMAKKYYE